MLRFFVECLEANLFNVDWYAFRDGRACLARRIAKVKSRIPFCAKAGLIAKLKDVIGDENYTGTDFLVRVNRIM